MTKTLPCFYCGSDADEFDHIVPMSRGGEDNPSNIVPACRKCNRSKGNKTLDEWREWKASRVSIDEALENHGWWEWHRQDGRYSLWWRWRAERGSKKSRYIGMVKNKGEFPEPIRTKVTDSFENLPTQFSLLSWNEV